MDYIADRFACRGVCVIWLTISAAWNGVLNAEESDVGDVHRQYVSCAEGDLERPSEANERQFLFQDNRECESDGKDSDVERKCACRGMGAFAIEGNINGKIGTKGEIGKAVKIKLDKDGSSKVQTYDSGNGLNLYVMTEDDSCLQAHVGMYINNNYLTSKVIEDTITHISVPKSSGQYKLMIDQPVYMRDIGCRLIVRAAVNNNVLTDLDSNFVNRMSVYGLWNYFEYDGFRMVRIEPEYDEYISVVQGACSMLKEHPLEQNVYDVLIAKDKYGSYDRLDGVDIISASVSGSGDEELYYGGFESVNTISTWFENNLSRYYGVDSVNHVPIDKLWKLCEGWREIKGFVDFLKTNKSINTYVSASETEGGRYAGGSNYIRLQNIVADYNKVLSGQVFVNTSRGNCRIDHYIGVNGESKGGATCMESATAFHGSFERSIKPIAFLNNKVDECCLNYDVLEKALVKIVGDDADLSWRSKLAKFARVKISNIVGKVITTNSYWEQLDLTIIYGANQNNYDLTMVLDGMIAPGSLLPPSDSSYTLAISDVSPNALAKIIAQLQEELGLGGGAHVIVE